MLTTSGPDPDVRRAGLRAEALCAVCIAILVLGCGLGGSACTWYLRHVSAPPGGLPVGMLRDSMLGCIALALLCVVLAASLRHRVLMQPGAAQASDLGARVAQRQSLPEVALRHVVEELALAAAIPTPEVMVFPLEHGINACVLGHRAGDLVVCVTMGALRRLSRQELQGLLGQQIAHVAHQDLQLHARLQAWSRALDGLWRGGTFLIMPVFLKKDGDIRAIVPLILLPAAAAGLVFAAMGGLGHLAGRALHAALARRRQQWADATALRWTKDPQALAAGLRAIGACPLGSRLVAPRLQALEGLFVAPTSPAGAAVFASHLPLAARIRAVDPGWNGAYGATRLVPMALLAQAAQARAEHPNLGHLQSVTSAAPAPGQR